MSDGGERGIVGPLHPSGDGRDERTGQFLPGNAGGKGNPHARHVAALRSALIGAVTPEDVAAAVRALIDKAKAGDVAAIRELLDRCIGKAEDTAAAEQAAPGPIVFNIVPALPPGGERGGGDGRDRA